ncbi:MAG: mannose-6-phosphate isomerase [Candidatus Berkelbacteria bacterium Licking1014_85]|uniref:Mannose-6-phosphate isomerase n=1 Tax=Candidatus Berkelbacteria bacterium Licking1014_85 TaxID=2017148 RepID=A0A554LLR3_9BACT|nr:MAG: mannose-6-phosphate isomerase [Candidatus Berkelbacteria bacterium Licking1014_85]
MQGYVEDIEELTLENNNFRKVLYTAKNCQLVVMNIKVGEEIGEEIHTLDQFLRVEKGTGKAIIDGNETEISDGFAIVVPAGAKHNVINTGDADLKLYTIYSPPNHLDQLIHATKADAEADTTDHYDGKTTE